MTLQSNRQPIKAHIKLGGSKSISNRLLVLKYLLNGNLELSNISDAEDTDLLRSALHQLKENPSDKITIDIHHAGTAMRFLTAVLSFTPDKEFILTGSERMKQRPIGELVNALRQLGADIEYMETQGFPPLKINGKIPSHNEVTIAANISSQFITALCLIGTKFYKPLNIKLEGKITSLPYLMMTLQILNQVEIKTQFKNQIITIFPQETPINLAYEIESDWSSASYFYSIVALSPKSTIEIASLFQDSLQGDSRIATIYNQHFGVDTQYKDNTIFLTHKDHAEQSIIELDLNDCPDIAQTIAVTAFGLKQPIYLTGLETLKVKETDRIIALKNELEKLGAIMEVTDSTLKISGFTKPQSNIEIETYNDHRMAMAFAPLWLKGYSFDIQNPQVVEKSYPNFWNDLKKLGFK